MSARGQDLMDITQDSRLSQLSMAHKDEPDGKGGASEIQELLDWNNLIYTMPVTNSVVAARNIKSYRSDIAEYKMGQTIEFRVQTGSQFVDWKNSWLSLTLEIENSDATNNITDLGWGVGSVCNLIRDIVVSSRSGAELQRIELFNLYRVCKDYYSKSRDWFSGPGSKLGYPRMATGDLDSGEFLANGTKSIAIGSILANNNTTITKTYCIPMSLFEGVFAADQLCPSYLASGMRIELRLMDTFGKCVVATSVAGGTPAPICTVKKAEIFVDTYMLNDAAMIELKKVSAQNGLEYVYTSIYSQNETVASATQAKTDLTVTKSVSRALTAFSIRKSPDDPDIITAANDSFRTEPSCILSKYQWRLGSQYYPHQQVEGTANCYSNVLYAFDTFYKDTPLEIREFRDIIQIAGVSFERSNLLRYSGAPINNSRVLSYDGTYTAGVVSQFVDDGTGGNPTGLANDFTVFLEYVTVAKVFLNNVVVTL